jgi:hypothetical protein
VATDWTGESPSGPLLCPPCRRREHCHGGTSFCGCPCAAEDPARLADFLLEYADQALANARQMEAGAVHHWDQTMAEMRVQVSQIRCKRCYGDLDAPDLVASIGTGRCTCELRCPDRDYCLASENGEMP